MDSQPKKGQQEKKPKLAYSKQEISEQGLEDLMGRMRVSRSQLPVLLLGYW